MGYTIPKGVKEDITSYVFVKDTDPKVRFSSEDQATYDNAITAWKNAETKFISNVKTVISSKGEGYKAKLKNLRDKEREKEQTFINSFGETGVNVNETSSWTDMINCMNIILQGEDMFKKALKLFSTPIDKSKGEKSPDAIMNFARTFALDENVLSTQTIMDALEKDDFSNIINTLHGVIKTKWQNYYKEVKNSNTNSEKTSYEYEFFNTVLNIDERINSKRNNQFFNGILRQYGLTQDSFKTMAENARKAAADTENNKNNLSAADFFKISVLNRPTQNLTIGGISEFTKEEFSKNFQISKNKDLQILLEQTGSFHNIKPDNIFVYSFGAQVDPNIIKTTMEEVNQEWKGSGRIANIDMTKKFMEKLIQKLNDFTIVEVSNKNYLYERLCGNEKGFGMESPTLDNVLDTINATTQANIGLIDRQNFLYYFINSGSNFIGEGNNTPGLLAIAKFTAAFLFDDTFAANKLESDSRIHVFNLNSIYIPLSIVLTNILNLMDSKEANNSNLITTSYTPGRGFSSNEKDQLTKWKKFYQFKISQDKINFHIFKNFTQYITELVNELGY